MTRLNLGPRWNQDTRPSRNNSGCEQILTVTVGQSHAASLTLSKNKLNNVEPGSLTPYLFRLLIRAMAWNHVCGSEGLPPGLAGIILTDFGDSW
ncbi:MAG: hypothetical protein CM1200mP21_04220 [Candidatus Poseidoniales archaeon]|nr:MAG: hypothetical protein CM1200mP21_04220 [Candidatus Poseidoniales archaeon]